MFSCEIDSEHEGHQEFDVVVWSYYSKIESLFRHMDALSPVTGNERLRSNEDLVYIGYL